MKLFNLHYQTIARLLAVAALFLASLSASGVPIPPPGTSLFLDPQLQACFDEAVAANGWTTTEEVTSLACPNRGIHVLSGIEILSNLQILELSGNNIFNGYHIEQLTQLQILDLSNNDINHGYDFSQLTQLQILDLSDNALTGPHGLQFAGSLLQLNLSYNSELLVADIRPILMSHPGLTHFKIAGIPIDDLDWLRGTPAENALQVLDISHIRTDMGKGINLGVLEYYSQLRELRAAGNEIEVIGLFQGPQLEVLDLSDNKLSNLLDLQFLTKLKQLHLSNNPSLHAADIRTLIQQNPNLTHISLANIDMGGLSWLPPWGPNNVYDLQEIDISNCGDLMDLTVMEQYINLRVLKAAGNNLSTSWPADKQTQLEILDLSDNQLVDIYQLQSLSNLKQLNLSGNAKLQSVDIISLINKNPGLSHIAVAGINMGDLNWLPARGAQGEYDLQALDVSHSGRFTNLGSLGQYTNLRQLKAAGNQLQDVDALNAAPRLEVLDLSDNKLMPFALNSLQQMTGLKRLFLSHNPELATSDFAWIINNNRRLSHIAVAGIPMSNLNWLPTSPSWPLENLQELDISYTISKPNLWPMLSYYKNLRVFKSAGNYMDHVPGIAGLEQLEVLDLSHNQLSNTNELPYSGRLKVLDLSHNQLTDIHALQYYHKLKQLNLSHNSKPLDAFPLQQLKELTQLNLSYNKGVQPLQIGSLVQNNPGLTHLGIAGINMGDLSWLPLPGPNNEYDLQELDISYIGDFDNLAAIAAYPNLRVLRAVGNRLSTAWHQSSGSNQLEVIDLSNNRLLDVFGLQTLNSLQQLNLSNNPGLEASSVKTLIQANSHLTEISVAGINMGDLSWLPLPGPQGEFELEVLNISHTGTFPDLAALDKYPNLQVLKAAGNSIETVWHLAALKQLEIIDLASNALEDIPWGYQSLTGLKQLVLSYNNKLPPTLVKDLILQNPGLTHIGVAGIAFAELNWLLGHRPPVEYNLQELDISYTTKEWSFPSASTYPNLRVFKAAGNNIGGGWSMDWFPDIEILDLSHNQLELFYSHPESFNLKQLNLSHNNKLTTTNIKSLIQAHPGLTHIGVAGIAMGDLSWLPQPSPMGDHDLQELDISHSGRFDSLDPVLVYSNLRVLKAAGNFIKNTGLIHQLGKLEALDLSDNQIENISLLGQINSLQILDLSGNQLWDVFSLQGMHNLSQLNLSNNARLQPNEVKMLIQQNPKLTHIGVAGIAMEDLSWLPQPGPNAEYNLQELDISYSGSFEDLAPLTSYPNLRILKAAGNHVVEIWHLDSLLQLEVLDLSDNQISMLHWWPDMVGLKQLYLSDNPIVRPDEVKRLINQNGLLTHIDVAGIAMGNSNWIPRFDPYTGAYNLQVLDISYTNIYREPFYLPNEYPNLRMLKAAGNYIAEVPYLNLQQQLEVLDLSDNQLTNLYGTDYLDQLQQLNLSYNKQLPITDVQRLIQSNPGLTHIGIAGLAITDLNWLPPIGPQGEFDLLHLDMSYTGNYSNLTPVAQYKNLRELKLAANQLLDINPLNQLTQLESIDLSHNELTSIVPLQGLTGLRVLNLSNNNLLQRAEVEALVLANPGLSHIGVAEIPMGDLTWLPNVGPAGDYPLQVLNISHTGRIIDLGTLGQYHNLSVLLAAGNQTEFISGFGRLTQLEVLDLSDNDLLNIQELYSQTRLQKLNLSNNRRLDPAEVKSLVYANPGLTHLAVADIAMGNPRDWLPASRPYPYPQFDFQELDISRNGSFDDLVFSDSFNNLRVLKAAGNQLIYVSGLHHLPRLEILDLSDNDLRQGIDTLGYAYNLIRLDLRGNLNIQCSELDRLESSLGAGVLLRPATCLLGFPPVLKLLTPTADGLYATTSSINFSATATDKEDGDLATQIFWTSNLLGSIGSGGSFSLALTAGEHVIDATVTDSHGYSTATSVTITVVANTPPSITVSSIKNGDVFDQGVAVNLTAIASDAEDGDLSTTIQWASDRDGVLGQGASIQPVLSVGAHNITASVVDAFNVAAAQLVNISINAAPQLILQSPIEGSIHQQQESISFIASASDLEDGVLDASIQWASSLDGILGTGALLEQVLTIGDHVITVSVEDSRGVSAQQTFAVKVNSKPQLSLLSPTAGSLYMLTEAVSLTATATDLEDGDISTHIVWSSSLDGYLGAGNLQLSNLSLGEHVLTASIFDSHGGIGRDIANVEIDQIDLQLSVLGFSRWQFVSLYWPNSRVPVDIYKDGVRIDGGSAFGVKVYRLNENAVFKVCETGTEFCSEEQLAQKK